MVTAKQSTQEKIQIPSIFFNEKLTPFEVADALQRILTREKITQANLAIKLGVGCAYVTSHMGILKLVSKLKKTVIDQEIHDVVKLNLIRRLHKINPRTCKKLVKSKAGRKDYAKALKRARKAKNARAHFLVEREKSGHSSEPCLITKNLDHETAEITYTESKLTANVPFRKLVVTGCEE